MLVPSVGQDFGFFTIVNYTLVKKLIFLVSRFKIVIFYPQIFLEALPTSMMWHAGLMPESPSFRWLRFSAIGKTCLVYKYC